MHTTDKGEGPYAIDFLFMFPFSYPFLAQIKQLQKVKIKGSTCGLLEESGCQEEEEEEGGYLDLGPTEL